MQKPGDNHPAGPWPPAFSLDQTAILNLLTGDRFYSNPSAALREAVLNAIDAVTRRRGIRVDVVPEMALTFTRATLQLSIDDNGVGMNQADISDLFAKVGASAASAEAKKESVGEFGIGVISYFMAADRFTLQTFDGVTRPIGLIFDRGMLAGGNAEEITPARTTRGTTVTLNIRDEAIFRLLLEKYRYWCRDVVGLTASADGELLEQGTIDQPENVAGTSKPIWIEHSHLAPIAQPSAWDAMTGESTIAILYRGVFVQEFKVRGLWGIEGSIDVNPKHFKPRLNREGFIEGDFQREVEEFLRSIHPLVLQAMAKRLEAAVRAGRLDKWTEKRWANLWLSVPRQPAYAAAVKEWDAVFRSLPAFEVAEGTQWKPTSVDDLVALKVDEIFVAPLADENVSDIVRAAVRLLRSSGRTVMRGIQKDKGWMRFVGSSFGTTADLIAEVFSTELPRLTPIQMRAEQLLAEVDIVAPLFTGPPAIDLVRLGNESPPALRLADRLVINVDSPAGVAIIEAVLRSNNGPSSLVGICARHAYDQLTQVAAAVRDLPAESEILSPVRRRHIRECLRERS